MDLPGSKPSSGSETSNKIRPQRPNFLRSYLRGCALVVIIEKFGTGFPDDIHKLYSRVSASESVGVAPPARAGRWKGEKATRGGTENGFSPAAERSRAARH